MYGNFIEGSICMKKTEKFLQKLRAGYDRLQEQRKTHQKQNPRLNAVLTWIFPLLIVCLAELNQLVEPAAFLDFCIDRTGVLLFDFLFSYLIYGLLLMLTNRVWVAAWVQGAGYMIISVVELFKYSTNGNHFRLTDLSLAPSVKNLTSFAYIKITLPLVIYLLLAVTLLAVIYLQNPAFTRPWRRRILPAFGCAVACFSIVCVPSISQTVYGVFDVDTTDAENTFSINEKFRRNNMLAFLVQSASENLEDMMLEPEVYDALTVQNASDAAPEEASGDVQPNVIVMMSESFADFRRIDALQLDTDAYEQFDAVAAESLVLNAAVPTFASYTVRTEFELMFGLPVRSLGDSTTPQREIETEHPSSMVSYYRNLGYETVYVHPFVSTFYGRDEIYATYGFDRMLFEDSLTVPAETYGNGYISDDTIADQLLALVQESEKPVYIHTTTMQNHQPYDWIAGASELDVYLEGVRHTGAALRRLTQSLSELDEPTVLLFIGDHFPSMRAGGNVYDLIGIDSENCGILYEQPALIWSNFDLDTSDIPQETVSAFYLTPMLLRMSGLPVDAFYASVLEEMARYPVYTSIFMEKDDRCETLDLLTYDRVLGENFSGNTE